MAACTVTLSAASHCFICIFISLKVHKSGELETFLTALPLYRKKLKTQRRLETYPSLHSHKPSRAGIQSMSSHSTTFALTYKLHHFKYAVDILPELRYWNLSGCHLGK